MLRAMTLHATDLALTRLFVAHQNSETRGADQCATSNACVAYAYDAASAEPQPCEYSRGDNDADAERAQRPGDGTTRASLYSWEAYTSIAHYDTHYGNMVNASDCSWLTYRDVYSDQ